MIGLDFPIFFSNSSPNDDPTHQNLRVDFDTSDSLADIIPTESLNKLKMLSDFKINSETKLAISI